MFSLLSSHRDADSDSVNTMVVHEDEGEVGEGEQAGGYGDQTMLVQRVSHLHMQWCLKCILVFLFHQCKTDDI